MTHTPVLEVYRAPMQSRDDSVDHTAAVRWALARGVVAVGGLLPEPPGNVGEAIERLAEGDESVASRLQRFAAVEMSSFVWTRTPDDGQWWLGRVRGPWAYDSAADAARVDLPHTRACAWRADPVPFDAVPAAVVTAFDRGGRNFQRIHDGHVETQTRELWDSV